MGAREPVPAPRRPGAMSRAVALFGLVLAVLVGAACNSAPAPSADPAPIGGRVVAAGFVLEVRLPSETYAVADSIPVTTTLTWTGAPGGGKIWGSGSGPMTFGFQEIGGGRRAMGGVMTSDCGMKEFPAGQAVAIPLGKSGGWNGDDPNAAFYRAWVKDPLLHLPIGHWQMRVSLGGYLAPCGLKEKTIEATLGPIDILVR